jgi:hypothetical protein
MEYHQRYSRKLFFMNKPKHVLNSFFVTKKFEKQDQYTCKTLTNVMIKNIKIQNTLDII